MKLNTFAGFFFTTRNQCTLFMERYIVVFGLGSTGEADDDNRVKSAPSCCATSVDI